LVLHKTRGASRRVFCVKQKMFQGLLHDPGALPEQYRDHTQTHEDNERIPKVVNVVTTAHFLPQEMIPGTKRRCYQFALHTLSMCFPVSQFKPSAFSSVIIRLTNGTDYFTCLFFSSGRCVFVRCKSPQHSLYVTQQVRTLFNNLRVPLQVGGLRRQPGEGGCPLEGGEEVHMDVLGKYVSLHRWNLENMVLSGNLGFRVSLPKLATVFAGIINYSPKDFPGAWCVVYIRPPSECKCTKTFKCGCRATVLVFDQGSVIVAGTRTVQDGNSVYYRFAHAMDAFVDDGVEFAKKDRYAWRIERFAEYLKAYADTTATARKLQKQERKRARQEERKKRRKMEEDQEQDEEEEGEDEEEDNDNDDDDDDDKAQQTLVMETVINESLGRLNMTKSTFSYNPPPVAEGAPPPPLIAACLRRQFANVQWLLENDPDQLNVPDAQGKMPWDHVQSWPITDPIRKAIVAAIAAKQQWLQQEN
jgi:TATA-box binding protein (TBP) (component of TFIID and TFIIIB)